MRSVLLWVIVILLSLLPCLGASAQPFSYIYIQGDKVIPFYVKVDGQMMPRYGKNYSILSELNPGPINIEIVFQQKIIPSRKFTIDVPGNGYRGFLLSKRDDGAYGLYDLSQKKYVDR